MDDINENIRELSLYMTELNIDFYFGYFCGAITATFFIYFKNTLFLFLSVYLLYYYHNYNNKF
jgi:hypothetical protein